MNYNNYMFSVIADFLLICHYSLLFSLSLLCTVFYIRTKDKLVLRLLTILYPLFLHSLACLLYYLFGNQELQNMETINSAFALFLLVLSCITISYILYATSRYIIYLTSPTEKARKFLNRITVVYPFVFFFFSTYFIVYLCGDNWRMGLARSLNELFLSGSIFLSIFLIASSFYLSKIKNEIHKRLLKNIQISLIPLILFSVLDWIFFLNSPYKLSYISYFIFCILVYLYASKHYVHKYEPIKKSIPTHGSDIYNKFDISDREQDLIPLLIEGKSNKEISEILFISQNTVKTHVRSIYKKVGVSNRLQLLSKISNHPAG